jgi:hypothetical protein
VAPAETVRDAVRRAISWLLLGWGAALFTAPRRASEAVLGGAPVPPAPVIRVLGARSAVQQAVLLVHPTRGLGRFGAGVDVLHALSMLGAAVVWPAYRRAALTSAGVAVGSAVVSGRIAGPHRTGGSWDDLWGEP